MALLARLARIPFVAATSVDYPGSLLDLRHQRPVGHEVEAALDLAVAAGGRLPAGDDGTPAGETALSAHTLPLPAGTVRGGSSRGVGAVQIAPAGSTPSRS